MKSLTLSPEQQTLKDDRRADYARRDRRTDHGTRGMPGHKKDYYGKPVTQLREALEDAHALADAGTELQGKRLKAAADAILKASGFVDQEPEVSFLSQEAISEEDEIFDTYYSDPVGLEREVDNGTPTGVRNPEFVSIKDWEDSGYDNSLEDEFEGRLRTRRALMFDADRIYQGHINPDDAIVDFEDGMHITDRP